MVVTIAHVTVMAPSSEAASACRALTDVVPAATIADGAEGDRGV